MADSASLRVADADREQLVSELREHMLAGRLTPDEFEERVERTYAASTRADLDAIKEDLPLSPAGARLALAARKARLRRRLVQEGGGAAGIWALCVGIWAANGASGSFWPVWVIVATLVPLVRVGWSLIGPDPDLESVEAQLRARRARRLAREHRHEHRHEHRGLPR
jgi:hypothetical protein